MYIEFLDNKKFPKKNADVSNNPEAFKDAGYLLKENDLVVDVDTIEKSKLEKLISLFNIKTQIVWTERGAHFYYKKPKGFKGSKKICPLGFEVEYKHIKNTPQGVCIKQNGKLRIMENEGIREDLPDIFYSRKKLESLLGMDEHEGRNNALFVHRMKISDLDQWKSILRFINNHVFATPMDENEFKEVSRDGIKIKAEKNNEPEIAEHMITKYRFVLFAGKLYWYEDKEYISDSDTLKRLIVSEVGQQKIRYINEVEKQIEIRAPLIESRKEFDIKLQNGILRNGEFYEIDYKEFTPYSIDIPYLKNAAPIQIIDDYLKHLSSDDENYRKRILETLAHCLITNKSFKRNLAKFFIFIGSGGNGKGTLLKIITEILGEKNCSSLSIKQMSDERYFVTMQGKLANLGDDIEDEYISKESMKLIKNISTCDRVQIRRLHEQSKDVELTCSLIFTSNHLVKSREKSNSYKRRVDWMPMNRQPPKKESKFIEKLTTPEALQYWMKLIVEAYKRLFENQGFTKCRILENYNEEYHKMNNNVIEFLQDLDDKRHWIGKQKRESFKQYKLWCEENDEYHMGIEKFHEELCSYYNLYLKRFDIRNEEKKTTKHTYHPVEEQEPP